MDENITYLYVGLMLLGVAAGYLTSFFFMKKDDKGMFYFLGFCVLFLCILFLGIDRAQFVARLNQEYRVAFDEYKETACVGSGTLFNPGMNLSIGGLND